ncbi:MAG TPA: ATP-grasp domain-containing protein [Natronosporangium sp.]|nr:ATP-grasp domain-containing protein [Natronosporangium sp.]
MTDQRPWLLVVGAGERPFREYLLASIGERYRVHLLTGKEPDWERPHLAGWTVLSNPLETVDATEMIAAARRLPDLAGVLAWDEARVLQAAKIAEALGLPGGDPEVAMRCRDKQRTRQALAAAGVPQPESALVSSVEEALAAAEQIGYPVVLKPRAMAASLGVVRVDTPEQLTAQFTFARDTTVPGAWQYDAVLVEECLTGPEVSVDAAVHAGEVLPMFTARKEVGYPPYFEEIGHLVDATDPLWDDPKLRQVLVETHRALGLTDAMTHTEFKLTPAGPKVIEVNARLGGDLIPYLGMQVTGIDPGLVAAAVACGQRPELTVTRRRVAAVRFFYVSEEDTTIARVEFDPAALAPGTETVVIARPGAVVSPPPKGTAWGRIAAASVVADTPQQCQAALAAAEAALRVQAADRSQVNN